MKKKLLSLLLAVAMMFSLAVTAGAEETAEKDMEGTIVILHTNDVHGAINGYANVAALKDMYEAMGAYVLLVDAGDFSQGETSVSDSQGATAVELMNLAGYDLAVPGNHEFDYGYANLQDLAKAAKFPVLAANILYNGKAAFETTKVFTAPDGKKIGFFGLTTPETATKAHPAKIKGVTFQAGSDLFKTAQAQVTALEKEGCDYIVAVGHLGIDDESVGNRSIDLLEKVKGIDLFIDGHSHSTLDEVRAATGGKVTEVASGAKVMIGGGTVNGTVITSTGTKLASVGVVTIGANGGISAANVPPDWMDVTPVKEVADRAAAIQAEIDKEYGATFAKTEVDLNGEKAPGNRTQETNLGDLITDALVWGAKDAGTNVDAAVTNGGGIRASIKAGDISKNDIHTVLPFGNTLSIVKVTGNELLEALEASTYCTPEAIGGFPQVSGITFTVDTAKAFDQGDLYPGSTYHKPNSINRVSIQTVGGKAFDPKATYTIATNDFMAAGGDTYYAFKAATVNYDLGVAMDTVVMDYITKELKGTITAKAYGETAGRITVKEAVSELPFTDVAASAAYYDAVKYCYDNNIFKGVSETSFAPDATMTRGQMVTVLWRMNGSPEPKAASPFTDVAAASPYAKAIAWAKENGLSNGTSETTFAPGNAISRQQFLTILYNYANFMKYDTTQGGMSAKEASDYDQVSEYAQAAMQWALSAGVASAVDGKLMPTAPAPRYQVAEFLAAFGQKVVPAATEKAA